MKKTGTKVVILKINKSNQINSYMEILRYEISKQRNPSHQMEK